MTAYARVTSEEFSGLSWVCEIHSVNRKILNLNLNLPKEILFLDLELRKMIAKVVNRGQVSVRLHFCTSRKGIHSVELLKKLKKEWMKIAQDLDMDLAEINLSFLLGQAGQLFTDKLVGTKIQKAIKLTVSEALETFMKMKKTEGKFLANDIQKRLKKMKTLSKKIESMGGEASKKYKDKLLTNLSSVLENVDKDERIFREVALIGEKMDITEEIIRLQSHIDQSENLLKSNSDSIGKTFDFLVQEMHREINTISSKSHDLEMTKVTIEAKAELEKIREQVQNIE